MKKILFLISGLSYSVVAFAQQVALNNTISIVVPKGAQKIDGELASTHIREEFNNNKILQNFYANSDVNNEYLYKVEDIVIEVRYLIQPLNLKKGMHRASKRD